MEHTRNEDPKTIKNQSRTNTELNQNESGIFDDSKENQELQREAIEKEKANPHTTENDVLGGISRGKTPEENRNTNPREENLREENLNESAEEIEKHREDYQKNIQSSGENKYDNGTAYKKADTYDNAKGLEMQKEYNEKYTNQNEVISDKSEDKSEKTNIDDMTDDAGYKQKEDEEMGGETTRKHVEENKEKGAEEGGAKDSHGVSIGESGNITGENDITENTKERATIDLTGRSVV